MHIDSETLLRVNINAPYKGFSRLDTPEIRERALVIEVAEPAKPADYSEDNYTRSESDGPPYVTYTRKADAVIAEIRWEKIKQLRDEKIANGGCKVGENWFHSDTHSKVQQLALVLAGINLPSGLKWKTLGGGVVDMTPVLAYQLYVAQMTHEQSIFAAAELKKMDDSDIYTGWPETYVPEIVP